MRGASGPSRPARRSLTRLALAGGLVAALASRAAAGSFEATAWVGPGFPFYEQAFEFSAPPLPTGVPGLLVTPRSTFRLRAEGGLALALSVERHLGRHLGVEARLDTADVSVEASGALYRLQATLAGVPVSGLVDMGPGEVDLERLRPLSVNLKARTSGRLRAGASAGVSYLPAFRFSAELGAGLPSGPSVGLVTLRAEARPGEGDGGRLGANVGLEMARDLGSRFALRAEARAFVFRRQTLLWQPPESALPTDALDRALAEAAAGRLEPVEFNPTFFQAAFGVAVRF